MIEAFDAAIFDMDGTILDSLGVWEKIDNDFLEKKEGDSSTARLCALYCRNEL